MVVSLSQKLFARLYGNVRVPYELKSRNIFTVTVTVTVSYHLIDTIFTIILTTHFNYFTIDYTIQYKYTIRSFCIVLYYNILRLLCLCHHREKNSILLRISHPFKLRTISSNPQKNWFSPAIFIFYTLRD